MKYIMYESKKLGQRLPIIFPNQFVHSDVDQAIKHLTMFKDLVAISAGELQLCPEPICTGKSETLNLSSNDKDEIIIENHDYCHGLNY